ncbi:hypothetical protein [Pontibacter harenae]|uniref:hypothetical protein n=1 Tax=Pontibacter harenae TaxID=2894083 RepID=UPI001E64CBD4|nr:hypothetical protein [Pontibacter harenae]MCC9168992.1 hypothetical protein [Pontibacter harenae]
MIRVKVLLLILIAFATESFACDCGLMIMEESYRKADFVISGKVEYVKDKLNRNSRYMKIDSTYWERGGYHAVLKVDKVYKGHMLSDTIEIIPDWSNCDKYFKIGQTYVVFGYVDKESNYTTSNCSGTFSKEDMESKRVFEKLKKEKI